MLASDGASTDDVDKARGAMRSLFLGRKQQRERASPPQLDLGGIDASWFVARQAITLGKQLGSGAFGAVSQCTVEGWSSSEVVAKRVLPQKLKPADADLLRNEITIWTLLNHPNTVKVRPLFCA